MIKKEKLRFTHFDHNYKKHFTEFEYELKFVNNELVSIRNEFLFEVDKKSFVWEHFSQKYGNV